VVRDKVPSSNSKGQRAPIEIQNYGKWHFTILFTNFKLSVFRLKILNDKNDLRGSIVLSKEGYVVGCDKD